MSQQKKNTLAIVFIAISVFLLLATAGLVYWNLSQREALNELVEQMTIEKAELEDEDEDLAIQFDGFRNMDIKNDSLQYLLTREQQRVQDLLEELRPCFADRFVLTLINNRVLKESDFDFRESGAVLLTDAGRWIFLQKWQERKKEPLTHPFLEEKLPWGLVPYVQSLLLARYLRGDLDAYPPFLWK